MNTSLINILIIFSIYAITGIFPLFAAYKSTSRFERLTYGFFLIYFSAFVLTGLALVTGVADNLTGTNTLSELDRVDLSEFMQYIIFGGFLFTLLFGSVGANIFTSALIHSDNAEIIESLRKIEKNTTETNEKTNKLLVNQKWLMALTIALFFIGLLILWLLSSKS